LFVKRNYTNTACCAHGYGALRPRYRRCRNDVAHPIAHPKPAGLHDYERQKQANANEN
jgi:hypothetical protein